MRWASLIPMIALAFGSASLATAECAWVFWIKHENFLYSPGKKEVPTSDLRWELMSAGATKNACEDVKARVWGVFAKECDEGKCPGVEEVKKVPNELVIHSYKFGGSNSRTLYCIPDTIDPREKK